MRAYIIISLLVAYGQQATCQILDQDALEQVIEDIFQTHDLEINHDAFLENMIQWQNNPINLNNTTRGELRSLYLLSEEQIKSFFTYLQQQEKLLSIYELQAIPLFDLSTIAKLRPFVKVKEVAPFRSLLKRMTHERNNYFLCRISRTLENKKGYEKQSSNDNPYLGIPYQIRSRFKVSRSGDFSLGINFENDAGEIYSWLPERGSLGFDFTSFHWQVSNKGKIKNIILGDYQAQFGQGLTLGGGFGLGKTSQPIQAIRRANLGFIPYTSINESNFFRGIALSVMVFKKLEFSSFFSYNKRDGSKKDDDNQSRLSSLSSTGLHRTSSEISQKGLFNEINYGATITYKAKSLESGFIFHGTHFDTSVQRNINPYNTFFFQGNQNKNIGIFTNYNLKNFTFFGEMSLSINHGRAGIVGIIGSLSPKIDVTIAFRHFDKNFYSFYHNVFSESGRPQNEQGYYIGWKYTISKTITLLGYVDFFKFPWVRYQNYNPSSAGNEWLLRWQMNLKKKLFLYIQAKGEYKINNTIDTNLFPTINTAKHNYWINGRYTIGRHFTLQSRVQLSTYQKENNMSKGFTIMQDIRCNIGKFKVALRYAFFDTDDFINRQYVYEQDVWLSFSFPAYNGKGMRSYAMVRYNVTKKIGLWLRWANTLYIDRETISLGNETIKGYSKNDVTFQVRIKL